MQSWEGGDWYGMADNIKEESESSQQQAQPSSLPDTLSAVFFKNFLQRQQQLSAMDTEGISSPNNNERAQSSNTQQQNFSDANRINQQLLKRQEYEKEFQIAQQLAAKMPKPLPFAFNPLTPPGLPPQVILPTISHLYNQSFQQYSLQQSPSSISQSSTLTPPMDITPPKSPRIKKTTSKRKNPPKKELSNSSKDLNGVQNSENGDYDESLSKPAYNSHGKMKQHKCKKCSFIANTKVDFWKHMETHMKPEKIIRCSKCPFSTDLKHHFEYHTNKHANNKLFKCDRCEYTCLNKSMLTSHYKSHNPIYTFNCKNCKHAGKYVHSFKEHLKLHGHDVGVILNPDGTPNHTQKIDVYGRRRGPKNKSSSRPAPRRSNSGNSSMPTTTVAAQLPVVQQGFPYNNQNEMLVASHSKCRTPVSHEVATLPEVLPAQQPEASNNNESACNLFASANLYNFIKLKMEIMSAHNNAATIAKFSTQLDQNNQEQQMNEDDEDDEDDQRERCEEDKQSSTKSVDSAMDLSQGTPNKDDQPGQTPEPTTKRKKYEQNMETPVYTSSTSSMRKGRTLNLDHEQIRLNQSSDTINDPEVPEMTTTSAQHKIAVPWPDGRIYDENDHNTNNSNNSSIKNLDSSSSNSSKSLSGFSDSGNTSSKSCPTPTPHMVQCKYCNIYFVDYVMYTIHMGYHSCDDAYKCNICGEKCKNSVEFFVHLARKSHE